MIQVHTTLDYGKFKILQGNRDVNNLHVKRLEQSISKNNLLTIITVNENYEIIDGQHRFNVLRKLELPINYVIAKGYGLNEIQILNANMKNWSNEDYLAGYVDLGYMDYIIFKDFKNKYKFNHEVSLIILSGSAISGNTNNHNHKFKTGIFKIADLQNSINIAENLMIIKKNYSGYGRKTFVYAMLSILKNKQLAQMLLRNQ